MIFVRSGVCYLLPVVMIIEIIKNVSTDKHFKTEIMLLLERTTWAYE